MRFSRLSRLFSLIWLTAWLSSSPIQGKEVDLSYYLPGDTTYASEVPTPRSVLDFEVGEWHVRHDQLVTYMQRLAASSERVSIDVTGKTHELRPLLLLTISSPENLAKLEAIRNRHLGLSNTSIDAPDTSEMPVVVYLAYSVHGNEASGSNASLLTTYHLAAARGEDIDRLLKNAVILLDPSLNPDGLARFAQWANMHRGQVLVGDPFHREHREGWPNGRTNHYWFDLNRDWLLAQHPESQARLEQFHRWRPNVLIDVHEMGSNSTYFFQPGVPVRKNPLTPQRNVELTQAIAQFHAEALDKIGSLYYSEETFDDFYYGKGSTYPDIHGAVGILFEQASARGHIQETDNGKLSFPFAVRNQFTTSLSTLRAALEKRQELLDYQREFFVTARKKSRDDDLAGYVFGDAHDPARNRHFVELLLRHRIEVHHITQPIEGRNGGRFSPGDAYFLPLDQDQYLLARTLFERRVDFADSTFYDVSTWTLPLAFNLPFEELKRADFAADSIGERLLQIDAPSTEAFTPDDEPLRYAYAFEWGGYYAPRALNRLLQAEIRARVATRPFSLETEAGSKSFVPGTIVVPTGIQEVDHDSLRSVLEEIHTTDTPVFALDTGLTPTGIDLGSPSLEPLHATKIGLLVGRGVNTYAAGEIWHLLDRRQEIPLSMIELPPSDELDLDEYSHLVIADGRYRRVSKSFAKDLRNWVKDGGTLIATQRAIPWVDRSFEDSDETKSAESPRGGDQTVTESAEIGKEKDDRRAYGQFEKERAKQLISGAIFEVELDLTHPLAYGYRNKKLPVFRNHRVFLDPPGDPYTLAGAYSREPLLSGYVSSKNLERLSGSPALVARREGRGTIIYLLDNPSFRAFWYGTDKLLMNAIFFGPILEDTARRNGREAE